MRPQYLIGNFLYNQKLFTSKRFVRTTKKLIDFFPDTIKTYTYRTTVTFAMTTEERNVSHSKFAELFGVVRELYGMAQIPNFKIDIGEKYLLKTRNASYQYLKDFHFGEEIIVKMFVTELTDISYRLVAGFYCGEELRTIGTQKIIYTNMEGMPVRMPEEMRNMLGLVEVK